MFYLQYLLQTFATKVNKVEPLRYDSTIEETLSEDDSIHRYPYEDRLSAADKKCHDENASTTALLDERLSESGESSDVESECKAGEILTLEGTFIQPFYKQTEKITLKKCTVQVVFFCISTNSQLKIPEN